jgi:DNA-binding IclR family transcriptional regulator
LTNKQISEALNIPSSTCYRILSSLKKIDLVYQRKPDLHYFLGFAHLRYAEAVIEGMDISTISLPYLEDLHAETEETTFLTLFSDTHCVVMDMCGYTNVRIAVGRGEILPLYCSAAGKAVLAFLPKRERETILKKIERKQLTPHTITDLYKLNENLDQIRKTGVSYCIQEFHNGINALATPLFNSLSRVVGTLDVVGTSVDMDLGQMKEYGEAFLEASIEITERMGGKFPRLAS